MVTRYNKPIEYQMLYLPNNFEMLLYVRYLNWNIICMWLSTVFLNMEFASMMQSVNDGHSSNIHDVAVTKNIT